MRRASHRIMKNLCVYDTSTIAHMVKVRPGETKVGQSLKLLPTNSEYDNNGAQFSVDLERIVKEGARYAILGIPEDIGPRANLGRGGAHEAFSVFLRHFLNFQSNRYIRGDEILLLGHVNCSDLQEKSIDSAVNDLRLMCSEIDYRVGDILLPVFSAGLTPIIIGGGHNNCYPILKSLSTCCGHAVNAINLDPHADFRAVEGRHSGNGFSYSYKDGYLSRYHVMGLHELKNNEEILKSLSNASATYDTFQSIFVRKSISFEQAMVSALDIVGAEQFGIELDVDCITGMPVSAYNECGITVDTAAHYIYLASKNLNSRYLHLCEAAPMHHPSGLHAGEETVGQILAHLASTFLQTKQS